MSYLFACYCDIIWITFCGPVSYNGGAILVTVFIAVQIDGDCR